MASLGNQHCANCIGTLSFHMAHMSTVQRSQIHCEITNTLQVMYTHNTFYKLIKYFCLSISLSVCGVVDEQRLLKVFLSQPGATRRLFSSVQLNNCLSLITLILVSLTQT